MMLNEIDKEIISRRNELNLIEQRIRDAKEHVEKLELVWNRSKIKKNKII